MALFFSAGKRLRVFDVRRTRRLAMALTSTAVLSLSWSPVRGVESPEAQDASKAVVAGFGQCIANLQQKALQQGVPEAVVTDTLPNLRPVPRVIELDRRQPEFSLSFANYLNRRVTPERVAKGRALLQEHRALLNKLVKQYGIPAQYLVAFWGLETNYGSYLGKMPILDSLATLACDQRRSAFFTGELFDALRLLQQPGVRPPMLGSWAGAMGHTQFMPSAYRRYARDGDGDGRVDLWGSIPDALTSAANFLEQLGWQRELRWGREVRLPADYHYQDLGLNNRLALDHWRETGLHSATGAALPRADVDAALLVPAGHHGPAFLVYDNFDVIMRWNRSEFYALSVGYLADRINGAGELRRPPPTDMPNLSVALVKELQSRLNDLGFDTGEPDGILGPATREAIRAFQQKRNMVADGYPSHRVLKTLDLSI